MRSQILLIFILAVITAGRAQFQRDKERQIKDQLIGRNYDPNILPLGINGTGPVFVNVTVMVKNFFGLDPRTNTMELQLLVRMQWTDPRLAFPSFPPHTGPQNITLASSLADRVWIPQLYYQNSIKKDTDKANQLLRIYLDKGDVEYSTLVTLTTICQTELRNYPHDVQECLVKISSYGNTESEIVFNWNKRSGASVSGTADFGDYDLKEHKAGSCDTVTETGVYSCLQLSLELKRQASSFLIHVYIPCAMLIIASYLTYFLHPTKSATPRIILASLALGLAVVGITAFNLQSPKVSYTKAIDIWTGLTLTFIFASVIEFVAVNYMIQYCHCNPKTNCESKETPENAEQQTPLNPGDEGQARDGSAASENTFGTRLDVIFRIAVPILFLVFVIIYWLVFAC